ncbi:hypothetical protein FXO37_12930 [Capsicum annuum]|nr:hypothetical protein FXO37_12930 [Capsicum annuum]
MHNRFDRCKIYTHSDDWIEGYVQLLSSSAFYIKAKDIYWQMRTFKWEPWFEPNIKTTIGVAWILMPDLPPNSFEKKAIFSIAYAVRKPLTVDMAARNQTRPSCATVNVEVDLIANLPQRVRINKDNEVTGAINSKWIIEETKDNDKHEDNIKESTKDWVNKSFAKNDSQEDNAEMVNPASKQMNVNQRDESASQRSVDKSKDAPNEQKQEEQHQQGAQSTVYRNHSKDHRRKQKVVIMKES